MTARTPRYVIDPIRGERDDARTVIGWRLVLLRDGAEVERREFDGGGDAYANAQDAGGAWLQQQGGSSVDAFTARAMQASRRMAWDLDYRYAISRRGF